MAAASVAAVATPAAPITMPVSCSLLSETLGTSTAIWTEPALPSARLATRDPQRQGLRRQLDGVVDQHRDRSLAWRRAAEVRGASGGRFDLRVRVHRQNVDEQVIVERA